jgi:drug/metabolite transporter (DMT)-like permease
MLQKYGAVALHSFIFIMPVAGVVLGGLVLGEPITIKIISALLLIVAGILVVHFRQEKLIPLFSLGRNI